MKHFFIAIGLFLSTTLAQPVPTQYFSVEQKDSLYYLLTDKALFKFYSHDASGEFFLTNYIEKDFTGSTRLTLNDQYLFLTIGDTIYIYSTSNAEDLALEGTFVPGYPITSIHGFGPYFFIRSGNIYNLLRVENGSAVTVEASLFSHPGQMLVFFTYPYVVIGQTVYKYVEGFDFYAIAQISIGNVNLGITGNKIIGYYFWRTGPGNDDRISILEESIIEEPYFPQNTYEGWGMNINQLHLDMGNGTLIARKNLYFMLWVNVIVTPLPQIAYIPSPSDNINITDYYIFLLGDSVQFSKWNEGSTFYPFAWAGLTSAQETLGQINTFSLSQNYPNPFNPTTTITYEIPHQNHVTLKVYNTLGQEITTLVNEEKSQGRYETNFDASELSSGIYFYVLSTGDFVESKKMVLIR